MKDRIPKYAGRVKLTPVADQPNIYDMERADEPVEEGTPLKKATLLDDETALSLGLTGDSNVNDAFGALSRGKVNKSDIIDNLTTPEAGKLLSANQGVVLNGLVADTQEAITNIANKFSNGILKIENGGTGSNNLYHALEGLGLGRTYIGQYEGTGVATLNLVLPYKPKAVLIMSGNNSFKAFGIIEFSKISTQQTVNPVVYYTKDGEEGKIDRNLVDFNEETNTLTIFSKIGYLLAFNNPGATHTYIMFG